MIKKVLAVVLVFAFMVAGFGVVPASAYHGMKGGPHMEKGGMDLEQKFCGKVMMMLENEEKLGLTAEQVEKIKKLKFDTKRYLISKKAEIDLLCIDIKEEMWKDKMSVEAIDKLIDKKYDLKKEKAKKLVKAIDELKSVLSEEQYKTLKSLYHAGPKQ